MTSDVGASELKVGKALGLDDQLVLAKACADFYVLESLYRDVSPWDGDDRYRVGMFPIDFGRDSRAELFGLKVHREMDGLTAKLAEQFSIYMQLACGGELRHVDANLLLPKHGALDCHHQHGPDCCTYSRYLPTSEYPCKIIQGSMGYPTAMDDGSPFAMGCGCANAHYHGWRIVKDLSHYVHHKCRDGLKGCQSGVCCTHRHLKSCYKPAKASPYGTVVEEYVAKAVSNPHTGRVARSTSWDIWWELTRQDPGRAMEACAMAFDAPIWARGSIGGPKWATAAHLVADYLQGNLQPRTYIDRCWSLQHNNGSLFNKFYDVYRLDVVLERQAENGYDDLALTASRNTQELWRERGHHLPGRDHTTDLLSLLGARSLRRERSIIRHDDDEDQEGCAACVWYYNQSGSWNPCGYGNHDVGNCDCAYYDDWLHDSGDCGGCGDCQTCTENCPSCNMNPENDGCQACQWEALENGNFDLCSAGVGNKAADAACMYYKKFIEWKEAS